MFLEAKEAKTKAAPETRTEAGAKANTEAQAEFEVESEDGSARRASSTIRSTRLFLIREESKVDKNVTTNVFGSLNI